MIEQDIIDGYAHSSIRKLSKESNLSAYAVRKILIQNNIKLRTGSDLVEFNMRNINNKLAAKKRKAYFASDLHKERASKQAKGRWDLIRAGLADPPRPEMQDTKPELAVQAVLDDYKIDYIKQHKIGPYTFDFYLPDNNILIEVQGEYWHSFTAVKNKDLSKNSFILNNHSSLQVYYIDEIDTKSVSGLYNKVRA